MYMKLFNMKQFNIKKIVLVLLSVSMLSACSNLGVKPWERDVLARADMALENASMDSAFDDHIYFSKEASSGGKGFGGGGCGCN